MLLIKATLWEVYSIKMLTDWQAVFILEFEDEEIEVAKCIKIDSGKWHILSAVVSESVGEIFNSPQDALNAYKSCIEAASEE